jgi:hypothetical protein
MTPSDLFGEQAGINTAMRNTGAGPAEADAAESIARAVAIGVRSGSDSGGVVVGLNLSAICEFTTVTPSRMKPIATKLMTIASTTEA